MLLIPAIDLKDGHCVRLEQGRMDSATIFSRNPLEVAEHWVELGCRRLHLVDLNGAFAGEPRNFDSIASIVSRCGDLSVQVGGGIRSADTVDRYFDIGVTEVILGTKAIRDPTFLEEISLRHPGQVILGLDAIKGELAVEGWGETSRITAIDFIASLEELNLGGIVYTDIERDGMLEGFNIKATLGLAQRTDVPVIASGGLRDLEDLRALKLAAETAKVSLMGAIAGRSLYAGTLDFKEGQSFFDMK